VAAQTYRDFELLIVDDGSSDPTGELVRAWIVEHPQLQVRYFGGENRGVSAARNWGLRESRFPWVAFLDSDDQWLPDKLTLQMALTTDYSVIHGEEIWMRNGVQISPKKKHAKSGGRIFRRCVDVCCISPSTALIRRELLQEQGFREDFPVCEDYELWLRLSAQHEIGFVATPVMVKYDGHEDQLSHRFRAMDYFRAKALMVFLDRDLNSDDLEHVAASIAKKCDILLNGYHKYNQWSHFAEVEAWRERAISCLAKNHSAYSVAERRPRSLSNVTR
jgi:glycosyltransferase involved in cell wall biosynthesis